MTPLGASAANQPVILVNADDLGRSADVNAAILAAFERGLISSASIMANMPGFTEACERVKAAGVSDRIGVHLNLTQGRSLTEAVRGQPIFCGPDGDFMGRSRVVWRLGRDAGRAIETEFSAQVEAVVAAGIAPSHLDSHHHVHAQWPMGPILVTVARRYGIPTVRIARNCGRFSSSLRRAYRALYNARLARLGMARSHYFGPALDVLAIERLGGSAEVMVHPEFDPDGRLVDCTAGASDFDGAEALEDIVARLRTVGLIEFFGRAEVMVPDGIASASENHLPGLVRGPGTHPGSPAS